MIQLLKGKHMRRSFKFILFTFLLQSVVHAQEIERDYHENGQLRFEGISVVEEGNLIANYKEYFDTGELSMHFVTAPEKWGMHNYKIVNYVAPGLLSTKHTMEDGQLLGDFVFNDYFSNGDLKTRISGSSTLTQLTYKEYHSNGIVKIDSIVEFNNEAKELESFMTDASDFAMEYIHQDTSGSLVEYHPNGNIAYKGSFKDGEEDGEILYLTAQNEIVQKYTLKNGKKVGLGEVNTFYDNGQLKTHTDTFNGLESGLYVRFHEDGQLAVRGYYSQENIDGTGLESFRKGIWRYYKYHPNGNLAEETTYINETKSGKYQKLDSTGQILEAGIYLDGEMDGVWELYDEERGRTIYGKYDNGKLLKASFNLFNTIKVKNTCNETISVLTFIEDDWQINGWINVAPYTTKTVLETQADAYFIYVESDSYHWAGSIERIYQDEEYKFDKVALEDDFYSSSTQLISCD